MFDLLGLEMRVDTLASAAGAGDMSVNLLPADGEVWIVADALGYNDEGALNGQWVLNVGTETITLDPQISHGTTDRVSCYSKSPLSANAHSTCKLPIVLYSDDYLQWTVFGLGAGKKAYLDYIIYVLRGIPVQ